MQRSLVQIARIRMREVVPGDVVNRVPDETRGWFVVGITETLFDGSLQVADATRSVSFSCDELDIVGVQLLQPIDLPITEEIPVDPEAEQESNQDGGAEDVAA